MLRHPVFVAFFLSSIALAVSHWTAVNFFLYWFYPWFDTPMHFLGGFTIGIGFIWFVFLSGVIKLPAFFKRMPFFLVFCSIILGGLAWEFFELAVGISIDEDFFTDTLMDLLMDGLGALCAFAAARALKAF